LNTGFFYWLDFRAVMRLCSNCHPRLLVALRTGNTSLTSELVPETLVLAEGDNIPLMPVWSKNTVCAPTMPSSPESPCQPENSGRLRDDQRARKAQPGFCFGTSVVSNGRRLTLRYADQFGHRLFTSRGEESLTSKELNGSPGLFGFFGHRAVVFVGAPMSAWGSPFCWRSIIVAQYPEGLPHHYLPGYGCMSARRKAECW
jgi:hypothetical protein